MSESAKKILVGYLIGLASLNVLIGAINFVNLKKNKEEIIKRVENIEKDIDKDKKETIKESIVKKSNMSEEEAIGRVVKYLKNRNIPLSPIIEVDTEHDNKDEYLVIAYMIIDNGPIDVHATNHGIYSVNKETGEIIDRKYGNLE